MNTLLFMKIVSATFIGIIVGLILILLSAAATRDFTGIPFKRALKNVIMTIAIIFIIAMIIATIIISCI